MLLLTTSASRSLDRAAQERFGLPGIVLMENAAIGMTRLAETLIGDFEGKRIAIIAGPGNNGGDGYAIARHAANAGAQVLLIPIGEPRPGSDAARNAAITERMGIERGALDALDGEGEWDLLVDAIFGTGLDRPVEGSAQEAILALNRSRAPILAVDLPSGLDGDRGCAPGVAVEADLTAVTVAPRPAMFISGTARWIGAWRVVDIGAPAELLREFGTPAPPEAIEPPAIIRPSPSG